MNDEYIEKLKKILTDVPENNEWLIYHGKGNGQNSIPETFNVKVYQNKKGQRKTVTTDEQLLQQILQSKTETKSFKHTIMVDDSMWGFPLGGVLVGCTYQNTVYYTEIPVRFFQEVNFENKKYLDEYARCGLIIIEKIMKNTGLSKKDTEIIICTGYVNTKLKDKLREQGYTVNVGKITGILQDKLEEVTAQIVKEKYYYDLYYDPKVTDPRKGFQQVIKWVNEKPEERLPLCKTGWKYFKQHSF